jgi:hypothetical protein
MCVNLDLSRVTGWRTRCLACSSWSEAALASPLPSLVASVSASVSLSVQRAQWRGGGAIDAWRASNRSTAIAGTLPLCPH